MPILIACSPSTGSSLLRRILNRHTKIYCGPETSLLAKYALYHDWKYAQKQFIRDEWKQLPNVGWHHMSGVNLYDENNLSKSEIGYIVANSSSFKEFVSAYFNILLQRNNKEIWAEKTPSNAFAIADFKNIFPESKFIHITRNPFDAIASLVSRGMSVYNAICVYLLNTSQCLEYLGVENCHMIKYEDLVTNPDITMKNLLQNMGLGYEDQILEPSQNEKGIDHMSGWKYRETDNIGKASLNRYNNLSKEQKNLIRMGVFTITHNLDRKLATIADICNTLDYKFEITPIGNNKMFFKKEVVKDKMKRVLKKAFFNIHNYPIILQ